MKSFLSYCGIEKILDKKADKVDLEKLSKNVLAAINNLKDMLSVNASTTDKIEDSINKGFNTTLSKDIDTNKTINTSGTATIDLSGHTISNSKDMWNDNSDWSLLSVKDGEVTVTGGTFKAKENDVYGIDVQGGTLVIDDATVDGNISAVYVHHGKALIKGGEYYIQQLNNNGVGGPYDYLLNCYDPAYSGGPDRNNKDYIWSKGDAQIIVTGGKFHGFDPGNNKAEGEGTSFLADGYKSVATGTDDKGLTIYEVVKA